MTAPQAHSTSSIEQCLLITLPRHHHDNGNLTVVENEQEVPFAIRRLYYLYDVPSGEERGGHSHIDCCEFIVAASGSFDVEIFDGRDRRTVTLNRPNIGLLVTSGIWRVLNNFSSGSVCLVMASMPFDENDYVRDFDSFLSLTSAKR